MVNMRFLTLCTIAHGVVSGPVRPIEERQSLSHCSDGYYWNGQQCLPVPQPRYKNYRPEPAHEPYHQPAPQSPEQWYPSYVNPSYENEEEWRAPRQQCAPGSYYDEYRGCVPYPQPQPPAPAPHPAAPAPAWPPPPAPTCRSGSCPDSSCQAALNVIYEAGQKEAAAAFCSSYLSINDITSTVISSTKTRTLTETVTQKKGKATSTVATSTAFDYTESKVTSTSTSVTTSVPVITVTVKTVSTTTLTACVAPPVGKMPPPKPPPKGKPRDKRDASLHPPNAWSCHEGSLARLNSACNCLSLRPTTKTVTSTADGVVETATVTTEIPKTIISVTITKTSIIVVPSTTATTTTTTATSTSTATKTVFTGTVTVISDFFQVTIRDRSPNNGQFAKVRANGDDTPPPIQLNQPQMMGSYFSLGPDGTLRAFAEGDTATKGREVGLMSSINPKDPARLYALGRFGQTPARSQKISCSVSGSKDRHCQLMCTSPRGSNMFSQGEYWSVGSGKDQVGPPPGEAFEAYAVIPHHW